MIKRICTTLSFDEFLPLPLQGLSVWRLNLNWVNWEMLKGVGGGALVKVARYTKLKLGSDRRIIRTVPSSQEPRTNPLSDQSFSVLTSLVHISICPKAFL